MAEKQSLKSKKANTIEFRVAKEKILLALCILKHVGL